MSNNDNVLIQKYIASPEYWVDSEDEMYSLDKGILDFDMLAAHSEERGAFLKFRCHWSRVDLQCCISFRYTAK